jgi:hypothetical protein
MIQQKHNDKASQEFVIRGQVDHGMEDEITSDEKIIIKDLANWITTCVLKSGDDWHANTIFDDSNPGFLTALVHFSDQKEGPEYDEDGLIIMGDGKRTLKASQVLQFFTNPPCSLKALGVSAIDQKLMAEIWWATIGGSEGYMKYPMYIGPSTDIREQSCFFDWPNYPPESDEV